MKSLVFIVALVCLVPRLFGAVESQPPSGGGGAPAVTSLAPGADLALALSNAPSAFGAYQLGAGTYTVTPTNVAQAGRGAINLFNKTNLTIQGVRGQTIIDGSTFLGELLFATNSPNLVLKDIVFKGRVVTNITQVVNEKDLLWSGVALYLCPNSIIEGCSFINHHDQGLSDQAFNTGVWQYPSTNVIVRNCFFDNIGSQRTNSVLVSDGTAIVPTSWIVENNVIVNSLRGIEPYDDVATATRMDRCILRNNEIYNCLEAGILSSDATNSYAVVVEGNHIVFEVGYTRRGTNLASICSGLSLAVGTRWEVRRNYIRGAPYRGIYCPGSAPQMWDFQIEGNVIDGDNVMQVGIGMGDDAGTSVRYYNPIIKGNYITRCIYNGIQLYGTANAQVTDNSIIDCCSDGTLSSGIHLQSFPFNTNATLRGNYIIENGTAVMKYGIEVDATEKQIYLLDNTILNAATAGIVNAAGDQVQIMGPPRLASFTYNLPSIGAGGNFTTNFALAGTKTNDWVSVMLPAQFSTAGNSTNMTWTWWGSNDVVFLQAQAIQAADPQNIRVRAISRQVEPY